MSYRICFGGIHIESTTFTSYISTEQDFRIIRGSDLVDYYSYINMNKLNVVPVPLVMARAIPGGVVSKVFFDKWSDEYLNKLKEAHLKEPIDGILFDIHGAMSVEGMDDAEGYLATKVREVVGKDVLITATMDLHGNISDELFSSCDLLTCYRTAPHIDVIETKQRAMATMLKVLHEKLVVVRAKVDVPILLPGEKTSTEVEPGKTLYLRLEDICKNNGILDASIWMGFPWADQARCHSSIVITGTDIDVVKNEIESLATYYWSIRNDFVFVGPVASKNDAVQEAVFSNKKPFFISDTGDNPGAGGANDINSVLIEFLNIKTSKRVLFSSIFDNASIDELYKYNQNDIVDISLGGRVDPVYGKPVDLSCKILRFFICDLPSTADT